jgi:hypothetical protein
LWNSSQPTDFFSFGRILAASGKDRAFRLYLFLPAAKKGYRFNPLRVLVS